MTESRSEAMSEASAARAFFDTLERLEFYNPTPAHREKLRAALESDHHIPHDAPYADELFRMAWSAGVSGEGDMGYVCASYDELVELVRLVQQDARP